MKVRMFYALLIIVMLLAACTPAATPPPSAATQAPAATEAPAQKPSGEEKVLRMINSDAPVTLNVHLSPSNADSEASRLIVEPLAAYDENGLPVPILAEEIPTLENGGMSADLLTTTWKLRKGVKWSDGTDFTADDVVFTWQYIMNPEVGSVSVGSYQAIENIEAVDPYTAKITWKQPNSEPLIAFAALYGPIIQKKQFEPFNNATASQAPANLAPIGTGPFMVVEAKPGDTYVYVKNPLYRNADKVYFDRVILKAGGDAATAARAVVQTGEYDYAFNLSIEKEVIEDLNKNGDKGQIYAKLTSQTTRIALNHTNPDPALGEQRSNFGTEHPFLKDLKVRQALSLAIDRGVLVEQILGPTAAPTCNWANPPYLTMQAVKWPDCPQDMEKAKALLDEAGWKDTNGNGTRDKNGVEMNILFITYVNPVMQKIQEFVKASWEELGISVELKAAPVQVMFSNDRGNPDSAFNFFADAMMFSWGGLGTSTTARYLANMRCSQIPQLSNNFSGVNLERYCNPEYDKAYDQFLAIADPVKHDLAGSQVQDMWVNDVAGIPLASRAIVSAISNQLKGVRTSSRDLETWNIAEWYMEP
jgi:peptide/nickel transport system substrate-binding protein